MFDMNSPGRTLLIFGLVLAAVGLIIMLGVKLSWFGRLPGDIYIEKKGFTFIFPVTTSILISIILTAILLLLRRR